MNRNSAGDAPQGQEAATPTPPPPARPGLRERIAAFPGTFALIGITVLVFIAQYLSNTLLGFDIVLGLGAKSNPGMLAGQYWRLVTPIFLHLGLLHIAVNMYSLYIIGPPVERFFGTARMVTLYFLSGIGGVAMSLAFASYPSAGASGAIFGLLGALAAFIFLNRSLFGEQAKVQLRQIVLIAVLNLAIGLSPGIDDWGHLGGLIVGLLLAWVLGPKFVQAFNPMGGTRWMDSRPWSSTWPYYVLAAVLVLAAGLSAVHSPFNG